MGARKLGADLIWCGRSFEPRLLTGKPFAFTPENIVISNDCDLLSVLRHSDRLIP
jgi:hypothetical protein